MKTSASSKLHIAEQKVTTHKCVIFGGNLSSFSQSRSPICLSRHVTLNCSTAARSRGLASLVTWAAGAELVRRRKHEQFAGQNAMSFACACVTENTQYLVQITSCCSDCSDKPHRRWPLANSVKYVVYMDRGQACLHVCSTMSPKKCPFPYTRYEMLF